MRTWINLNAGNSPALTFYLEIRFGRYIPSGRTGTMAPPILMKCKMSATAGIRTRVASLEGLNPNQLDYSCNLIQSIIVVYITLLRTVLSDAGY